MNVTYNWSQFAYLAIEDAMIHSARSKVQGFKNHLTFRLPLILFQSVTWRVRVDISTELSPKFHTSWSEYRLMEVGVP
jgi:hypothetical protein